MEKFKPHVEREIIGKRPTIQLRATKKQYLTLVAAALRSKITIAGLLRQMIKHCMKDMGYAWPEGPKT